MVNTGRLNGLCAKLKQERLRVNPNKPLYSVWCVAHIIFLAWKSVALDSKISKTIQHCRNLSAYFNASGVRIQELKNAAEASHLDVPLR